MKFMVDECVGPTVAKWLRKNGYDVVSIFDESPGITDDEVLKRAFEENRILITSDKDFGEMVFKKRMRHCGILFLRLSREHPVYKIEIIEKVLKVYLEDLWYNFVVVTETTIRIIKQSLS